jgi:hypothetical protein
LAGNCPLRPAGLAVSNSVCTGPTPPPPLPLKALTSGAPSAWRVVSTRRTGSLLRPMRVVSFPSLQVPAPPSPAGRDSSGAWGRRALARRARRHRGTAWLCAAGRDLHGSCTRSRGRGLSRKGSSCKTSRPAVPAAAAAAAASPAPPCCHTVAEIAVGVEHAAHKQRPDVAASLLHALALLQQLGVGGVGAGGGASVQLAGGRIGGGELEA